MHCNKAIAPACGLTPYRSRAKSYTWTGRDYVILFITYSFDGVRVCVFRLNSSFLVTVKPPYNSSRFNMIGDSLEVVQLAISGTIAFI